MKSLTRSFAFGIIAVVAASCVASEVVPYPDGRSYTQLRMSAVDQGVVIRHGVA